MSVNILIGVNEAVDQVRRRENKQLRAAGDDRLVGSKQLWLFGVDRLSKERKKQLAALRQETLKTGRAWAIKEHFRRFWKYVYATSAADFFRDWHGWAVRSRLKPIADKAKMFSAFDGGWDVSTVTQNKTTLMAMGEGIVPPPGMSCP